MDLSVIIVSVDHGHFLEACFAALRKEEGSLEFEVLVVDNACRDETTAITRQAYPEATVINTARCGFAEANNLAMAQARGRHLLLLNPDTEVRPGALGTLVRYLDEHPEVGVVGARLLNPDGTLQPSCRAFPSVSSVLFRWLPFCPKSVRERALRRYLSLDWDHAEARPVDWVLGACLCARRPAVEQVGMMDEGYFLYYEDIDWCYRMWQGDWEVHYVPEAAVMHHYQRISARRAVSRLTLIHARSVLRFFVKHRLVRL